MPTPSRPATPATPAGAGIVDSGTEAPSRFMMGLSGDPNDGDALEKIFSGAEPIEPVTPDTETLSDDDEETPTPLVPSESEDEEPGDGVVEEDDDDANVPSSDFATRFQELYGRELVQSDVDAFFNLAQWSNGLTNEQRDTINTYIQQGYTPQQILDANTAPVTPAPQVDPELDRLRTLAEEYKDDESLGPVYSQMVVMREQITQLSQSDFDRQRQSAVSQINNAAQDFKTSHNLTEDELSSLSGAVTRSQLMPGFVQANGGDIHKGMTDALEFAFYRDPTLRNKLIEAEIESRATKDTEHKSRRRRAASVSGTGGNGASRVTPPAKVIPGRFPMEQITQEIREALSNGQAE